MYQQLLNDGTFYNWNRRKKQWTEYVSRSICFNSFFCKSFHKIEYYSQTTAFASKIYNFNYAEFLKTNFVKFFGWLFLTRQTLTQNCKKLNLRST